MNGNRTLPVERSNGRMTPPRLALVPGGVTVALMVTAAALAREAPHESAAGNVSVLLLFVPFAAVGVLIARRQPRNSIGWILIALALGVTLGSDGAVYAVLVYRLHDHGLPLGRLAVALAPFTWISVLALLPLPVLLFPDGRIPEGRWRWAFWAYVVVIATFLIANAVPDSRAFTDRDVVVNSSGEVRAMTAPASEAATIGTGFLVAAYVVVFLAAVLRQLLRYRHSVGDERQQLKWFLSGGAVAVTGVLLASVVGGAVSPAFIAVIALPIGIGMGILKYRLYDIDRLISRTLSYLIITGLLAAVFVGIVVVATDVLPFSSPIAVAASTLAAAALFNPLRKRVQRLVDRRFNRARYDAEAIVAAFTAHLREAVDLDTVRSELLHTVDGAVQPSHASLWIRPPAARSSSA